MKLKLKLPLIDLLVIIRLQKRANTKLDKYYMPFFRVIIRRTMAFYIPFKKELN